MSLYVLDTDTLTLFQDGHPVLCSRVQSHPLTELAITVISVEEQLTGWYTKLRRTRRREELTRVYQRLARNVQFLAHLPILGFSEAAMTRYDQFKAMKLHVGKKDLCIAAITLEYQGILVTRNLQDFQRIPNLLIEDWSA